MASLGHIAVGMAAARISGNAGARRWSSMVLWSALSLLPDADVAGFALGVQDQEVATHGAIAVPPIPWRWLRQSESPSDSLPRAANGRRRARRLWLLPCLRAMACSTP